MDELGEKLSQILNDPDSMNRVRAMAESLLSGKEEKAEQEEKTGFLGGEGIGAEEMEGLVKLFSRLNSSELDNRSRLLMALKPHLSDEKQKKVDSAVKILKLLELWPLIKDSGLISFL